MTISSSVTTGKKRSRESGSISQTASDVPAVLLASSPVCSSCIHRCSSAFLYTIVSIYLILLHLRYLLFVDLGCVDLEHEWLSYQLRLQKAIFIPFLGISMYRESFLYPARIVHR